MSIQPLLDNVPFVEKAGIQCEDYAPGRVVLSLPFDESNKNHTGTLHAAALYLVGETAAGAACATHPQLSGLRLLAKSATIRYRKPATGSVTAHAEVNDEIASTILRGIEKQKKIDVEVPVRIFNGHGELVAEFYGLFHFRPPA